MALKNESRLAWSKAHKISTRKRRHSERAKRRHVRLLSKTNAPGVCIDDFWVYYPSADQHLISRRFVDFDAAVQHVAVEKKKTPKFRAIFLISNLLAKNEAAR